MTSPELPPDWSELIEIGRSREREAIATIIDGKAMHHEDCATEISDAAGGIFGDRTSRDDEIEMHNADAFRLRELAKLIRARAPAADEPTVAVEDEFGF